MTEGATEDGESWDAKEKRRWVKDREAALGRHRQAALLVSSRGSRRGRSRTWGSKGESRMFSSRRRACWLGLVPIGRRAKPTRYVYAV